MSILGHNTVVSKNNRDDVKDALMELAMCDADFCGDNGDEYLWEEANGFECNAEYVLSLVSEESTISEMITNFVSRWMGSDGYYEEYDVEIKELDDVIAISVAFTTN